MENINRFIEAQKYDYDVALSEVKNGKKINHWMWYIFPQIKGLGKSEMAKYYGITDLEEAREYLNNKILGTRLIEISNELLKLNTNNPIEVFGYIDSMKLKSCMTLFDYISNNDSVFCKVLEKFYNKERDINTINICKIIESVENLSTNFYSTSSHENEEMFEYHKKR